MTYSSIDQLITRFIDDPNRSACLKLLDDNRKLFEVARGSTHNHQTWEGGYIDHVAECMNYGARLYWMTEKLRPLPFTLSDLLLVLFLHDLEKPWRLEIDIQGFLVLRAGLVTKQERKAFRDQKILEYGIVLTDYQMNGLRYVEGELDDYSSHRRVMNELAAMAHMVDTWSARGWFDHPAVKDDQWDGAGRFRS